ncbi:hypothetical protein OK349_09245 [Sphingomonas sp. BT-65]|uniref:hypothetical protein n=1 Tax=Sphingomonas sp. BT-65 TaxID=2989821 RepID=UPI002235F917|nr:hypothetical protein [Sphingomonas sp. BT-65]MCW4461893.1 hypothetical protein [Sphingomonas sp. BT-65]
MVMPILKGRRILFIAPRFFGYDLEIANGLRKRGAHVDWLADRPYDTAAMAALTRFVPQMILPFADRLYDRQLSALGPASYDHILVLNGQTVSREFLKSLRAQFPSAVFTLYMWDSLENRGRTIENFPLFDRLLSFDPQSADRYGMQLRPLFFTRVAPPVALQDARYDASFVGTAHSDRYAVITRLKQALSPELRAFWYLYLQSNWLFSVYKTIKPGMRSAKRTDFRFVPIDKDRLQQVVEQSLAVVDIEHPRQRGLTMRTFETMGLQRKLITTNRYVEQYEFFDRDNIMVIDRQSPVVPTSFFTTPYRPLSPEMYRRYSLEGWIDDVLGTDESCGRH